MSKVNGALDMQYLKDYNQRFDFTQHEMGGS